MQVSVAGMNSVCGAFVSGVAPVVRPSQRRPLCSRRAPRAAAEDASTPEDTSSKRESKKSQPKFAGMAAGPPPSPPSDAQEQPRQGGVLGRRGTTPPSPPAGNKTAADFIAEGIVDDVDEETERFLEQDIRFNVDDFKDPFNERMSRREGAVEGSAAEEGQTASSERLEITGDGGVVKTITLAGIGSVVHAGATVTVEYTGKLADGTVFDSSEKRKGGFSFVLGEGKVIKGWEAAVATMRKGEVAELVISPAYAYGRRGMPPVIPGNATLTFEVEVLSAEGGQDMTNEGVQNVAEFNTSIARTPSDISRDYAERLKTQGERRAKMSLLERFYIISPFASQTGERPPWFLNPNITFFIVFAVVAAAFYLVVESGGIHTGYVKEPIDVNLFSK
jgi:FKBP-type peptidyl-prolyl cis-trans isomerase